MARSFTAASSHYLSTTGSPISALPCTFACWFNSNSLTLEQSLVSLGDSASTDFIRLGLRGDAAGDKVEFFLRKSGNNIGLTSTAYSTDTWHHACGTAETGVGVTAYIDGGSSGTAALSATVPALDRTAVGALLRGSAVAFMSGLIAEPAIWNVRLTATEIARLATGVSPLKIRPGALVAYWPLWGNHSTEIDLHPRSNLATDFDLTVTGATKANHAPVVPYSMRLWGTSPGAETAANSALAPVISGGRFSSVIGTGGTVIRGAM